MTNHRGRAWPVFAPRISRPAGITVRCGRPRLRNSVWFKAWRTYRQKAADFTSAAFSCRLSVSMLDFTEYAPDGSLGRSPCGSLCVVGDRPFDMPGASRDWGANLCEHLPALCGTPCEMRFAPP